MFIFSRSFTMSIKFGSTVSLNEFANMIATVGSDVTVIGQGEPGIGKSSMLKAVAQRYPNYEMAYIDCTLLDLGDFALPYTEQTETDLKVTKFAPNARFKFQSGKPVIVMLDEIGKAMKAVKNVLLTLMLEKRIGDVKLPEGSIVFGTTNLATDGVGDSLEAHARNRVCFVTVRKPHAGFGGDGSVDNDSWGAWALDNEIAPEVIAWVKQFPQALESYTDQAQRDNPYIFNPTRAGQTAFVTPRSLEKASHIAKKRSALGEAVTITALAGTIGESAARDMQAFFTVVDKLPTWEAIMDSPNSAKVPDDAVAKCILVFSAISRVDKDTLGKWLKYADRLDKELQALFARSIVKSSTKQSMAVSNKDFVKWATDNQWLF
jgi:ATPase family associated with various cellular activities (AAA)